MPTMTALGGRDVGLKRLDFGESHEPVREKCQITAQHRPPLSEEFDFQETRLQ